MACHICGRAKVYHGSEDGPPAGSYLSEAGCQNGVFMDDDEYAEGWARDTVCAPCPFSLLRCPACNGSGQAPPDYTDSDDCPACGGNGWKDGDDQVPDDRYETQSTPESALVHGVAMDVPALTQPPSADLQGRE